MNISSSKAGVLLCALCSLSACATVGNETLSSPLHQKKATELLMAMDEGQEPGCIGRTVVKKIFVELYKPAPGEQDEIETWTIDRCGKLINYFVTLSTVQGSEEKLLQVVRQPEQ